MWQARLRPLAWRVSAPWRTTPSRWGRTSWSAPTGPTTTLRNANYPRDFRPDVIEDITLAEPGHACHRCNTPLEAIRAIEVGHVFKLGTFYSETLDATYLDRDGAQKPIIMGCYGIGVGAAAGRGH